MIGRRFIVVALFIALLGVFAGPATQSAWAQTVAPQWVIDGSGATGNGEGIATLSDSFGSNDYFGDPAGTLQIAPSAALQLINYGGIDLAGNNLNIASLFDDGVNSPISFNYVMNSVGPATLTIGGYGGSATFGGVIGAFNDQGTSLVITGANGGYTQALTGSNLFTGGATLTNGGVLNINADAALGATTAPLTFGSGADLGGTLQAGAPNITLNAARPVNIATGATAIFDTNSYNMTVAGNIVAPSGGDNGLTKINAGMLTLTGTNTFTEPVNVTGGTLQGTAAAVPTGVALSNNSYLALFSTNPNGDTYSQNITGTGSLVKTGSGSLVIQGNNTYSGATYVTQGILRLSNITPGLNEGWLNGGFDTTDPYSTSIGQSVQLGPRAAQWSTNPNNGTTAWVAVQSFGNYTQWQAPGPSVTGNFPTNTTCIYTGEIYLPANTVSFYKNFDDSMLLKINGQTLINDGGWQDLSQATYTAPAPGYYSFELRLGQGGGGEGPNIAGYNYGLGYDPNGNGNGIASNYILPLDPGNGSVFATGAAAPGNPNSIPTGSPLWMSANTTFDMTGTPLTLGSLNDSAGANGHQLVMSGATLTIGVDNTNAAFSGAIVGAGGVLIKNGTGTQTLTGSGSYTGGTVLNTGGLAVGGASALGSGLLTINGGTLSAAAGGGTLPNPVLFTVDPLFVGANSLTLAGAVDLGGGTRNINVAAGSSPTISGAVSDGALVMQGPGTLSLGGVNTYAGGTQITRGTLAIGGDTSGLGTGALNLNGGTLKVTPPIAASGVTLNVGGQGVGSYSLSSNGLTISGGGRDFWGGTEEGEFVYTPVPTNQSFSVAVHLASESNPGNQAWARAGIMIRQDATQTNCQALIGDETNNGNGPAFEYVSNTTNSNPGSGLPPISNLPNGMWLRLDYNASTGAFTDYASTATGASTMPTGAQWVQIGGTYTPTLTGPTFDLGIGESSHSGNNPATAIYDNLGTLQQYLVGTYNNPITVSAESTIQLGATSAAAGQFPSLTFGTDTTLHITAGNAISGVTITGPTVLSSVNDTFDVLNTNTLTLAGTVSGSAQVSKTGAGTLVLGSASNMTSLTGAITIGDVAGDFGGTVAAANSGALGGNALVTINNGILDIQSGYAEWRQLTLNNAGSTIQVDAGTYTPSLALSFGASGALTKAGAGTLALTNLTLNTVQNVTAAGGAINFGGTSVGVNNLTLSGGAVDNGTVNVAGTILAQSGSAGAQLSGNVSLNKTTGGTVVLGSSANNYSGGTNISAGILQINATGQLPVGGTVTMSGGTLQFSPIVAGLTSIYYGGTQANNNNGALNLPGVSATAQNINNLNLNNLETYVAGIPVGLTTNTTVKVGNTASWFNNSGSGMFDSVPNGPNYSVDPADNFIDVHTGFFYAPVSGTYQFQAGGDDVGRLWLDNNNAETVYNGGTSNIYLTAGEHPITIVHEEYGGGQNTYANVQGPAGSGINNQNIPNSMLTTATSSVSYNTNVTLPASSTSTIDVQGTSLVSLNALTLYNGSQLNTTSSFLSNMSSVQFNSTTLNDGTYTLNILGPSLAAGVFTTSGGTSLVNVIGTGTLVLNSSNSSLSGTTFNVGGSNTLMIVGGGGAFASQAGAAITLQSGATLQLATADTTPANYDLPGMLVPPASNVTYRAGMDFAGEGGAVANGIVNLSNGGGGATPFTVPTGQTLGFAANSGYTLNIVPQVNVASGGTLNGIGGATGVVNMTLNNSPGATVAPNNDNFIVLNLQGTNGQFSPSGTALANGLQGLGNVTFAGGFSGNTSQLTPAVNGFLTFPTANMIMSGSTVNVAGGGFILGNIQSLGAVPSQVTLELNGGTLGASNPLTINNPLIFGPNQSVNIAVATNMIAATSQIQFTSNISLTSGLYTFNDPFGRSTFWGVLSGAGSVAFTPTNGNPNNNTYNDQPYNNYVNGQTYSSPEIAGFNTYIGGTTINSTIVAITDRQAFGTGQLNYNWGGINALTNLTGELAVANPWSDIANFNNGEMWFRGPNSIDLSGPGTINYNSMFRIPDGGTVTISGAISGSGYFQRGGDPNGTLVLNDPLSTYTGAAGGQDWFYNSAVNNPSAYNVTGHSFNFPATSFWKNDNGGDQNQGNGNFNAVVLMVGSLGGSGTNVTSGPFGTGTVRWQYWGALGNGTSSPLTVGNDFVMEGDMGINGGVGLNLSGDMMIGNRDRNGTYRDLYTSGNVTLSGRLISTNAWNNNNGNGGNWAGLDLRSGSGGVVTLSGDNSMLYSVEITQGTLAAASNTALGSIATTGYNGNAGNGPYNPAPVQLGNGNTAGTNDGTLGLLLTGPVTVANSISVNNDGNGTTLGGNTNNSATFSGPISLAKGVNIASSATGGNTLLFSGVISNGSTTGSVNVVGPGNVTFAAANTYSGPTTLSGGLLTLDFSQGTSPTSNIVSGSSALILAGGNLSIVPNGGQTNSQTFASTTVNPGASTVSVGGGVLNLAAITRNVGGTVDFSGAGTINTTGQPANSILLDTNGVAYATVAGTDWAAVNGSGAIVPVGSYTPSTASGSEFVAGNNVDVSSGVNTQLPLGPSTITIASLRFNQSPASTIDVYGNSLTTGGILVTPNDGGSSIIDSLGGGSLQGPTASSDLVVVQNSPNPFTISANITGGGLTKSGNGTLVLGGNNTYTGTTYVNGGVLQSPVASLPTPVVLNNQGNVTISDTSASTAYNNAISGNGSLTVNMTSGGSLTLGGNNTYTGATHVVNGTLTLTPQPGLNQAFYSGNNYNQTTGWTSAGVAPGAMAGLYARGNGVNSNTTDAPIWGQGTSWQGSWQRAVNNGNDVTWTYTGYVFCAYNTISMEGWCDDNMQVKINGTWIGTPQGQYGTGIVNVTPGWVPVQISFFSTNGGGAGGYTNVSQWQVACNPDGNGGNGPPAINTAPAGSDFQINEPGIAGNVANANSVIGINPGSGIVFPGGTSQPSSLLFQAGSSSNLPANTALTLDAAGTLNLNNAFASVGSLSGAGQVNGGGGLSVGGDNTSTNFSGLISSMTGLTKTGAGTLTLANANTFTGATVVSGGAIQLGNPNSLGSSSIVSVSVNQGLLFGSGVTTANFNTLNDTGNLALVNADGNNVALSVTGGALSGVISDNGTGAGGSVTANLTGNLLVQNGRNTYVGPTVINNGTFQANDGGGLPAASALTLNNAILQSDGPAMFTRTLNTPMFSMSGASGFAATGGHFTVTLNGGATLNWGTDIGTVADPVLAFGSPTANNVVELTNAINLGGNVATIQVASGTGGDYALLSGNITGGAGSGVNKTGAGTLFLSGNNAYDPGVTITQGTVVMGSSTALGMAVTPTVTFPTGNTAALLLNGNSLMPNLQSPGPSYGSGATIENGNAGALPLTAVTLTLSPSSDTTFAGSIQNGASSGALSVVKAGPNVMALTGPGNTYSGGTMISAGTLAASSAGTGPIVIQNATFQPNGSFANPVSLATPVNSNIGVASGQAATLTGVVSGGQFNKTGPGLLSLTNVNNYTGPTYISGGTLQVIGAQLGLWEGFVGNYNFDTTDPIPHTSIQQTARWGLTNQEVDGTPPNSYPVWGDNQTYGYSGYLDNTSGHALTYDIGYSGEDDSWSLKIDGTPIPNNGAWPGTPQYESISLAPGLHTIDLRFGQGGGGAGPQDTGWNNLNASLAYNTTGLVGPSTTPGAWNVFGAADSSGDTLFLAGAGGGAIPTTTPVIMSSNTTFDLSIGTGTTIASLADDPAGVTLNSSQVLLGNGILTTGGDNTSTTFSGVLSGAGGGLTKVGAGCFTLLGSNTYTGPTAVNGGTLQVGNGGSGASIGSTSGVSMANNSVLAFNHADVQTLSGPITGTGSLYHSGPGTLTLTSFASTYNGGTTIAQGVVSAPVGGIGSGPLNLAGGTFHAPAPFAPGLSATFYNGAPGYAGNPGSGNNDDPNNPFYQGYTAANSYIAANFGAPTYQASTTASGNNALFFPDVNSNGLASGVGFANIGYVGQGSAVTGQGVGNDYTTILKGSIMLPAGTTNVSTGSDDGSAVYISLDGGNTYQTIVDNTGYQGWTLRGGPVTVPTAGYYPIEVAFYQGGGGNGLGVYLNSPGGDPNNAPDQYSVLNSQVINGAPSANYSNAVNVTADSTIDLDTSFAATYQFPSLTIGANTLYTTGGTTGSGVTITGPTMITGPATFNVGANAPLTLAGSMSGSSDFAVTGGGTLTLGADGSNFTGNAQVNNGTVQLNNATALVNSTVNLNDPANSTLTFGALITSATVGGLSGSGNFALQTNAQSPSAVALTVGANNQNASYSGVLSAPQGILNKIGNGTQTLSGLSTYTGATTVSGGVLAVTNLDVGGNPSAIGASTSGAGNLVIDNGTLQYIGNGSTTDRQFTIGPSGNATIDASGSGPLVFSNTNAGVATNFSGNGTLTLTGSYRGANTFGLVINDGNGPTSLVKNGPGTWILSGQSQYTGSTMVNAGKLVLAAGSAVDETAITVGPGATFAPQPGSGTIDTTNYSAPLTVPTGATLTLQHGSIFDMTDGAIGIFNLNQDSLDVVSGSNTGLTLNGATLKFDLSSTGADVLNAVDYAASCGTGNVISITGLGSSLTVGSVYPVLTASGSGLVSGDFALASNTISVGGTTYDLALVNSSTAESITVTGTSAGAFSGRATWISNGSSLNWSTNANWVDNANASINFAPGVPGRPVGTDTATFNGQESAASHTITLDVPVSLAAVSFTGANYTLTNSTLTMNSTSGTSTMTVSSGTQEIDSAVEIAGGNLAISLTNTGQLSLTNNISDDVATSGIPRSLTLTSADGTGTLILSGSNTYGGGTDVASGTLIAMNSASIPSGSSLIVGSGGAFTFSPATTLAPAASNVASAGVTVVSAVPEPGTVILLLAALAVCCGYRFTRRGNKQS